ncbi:MAG: hypothetical protein JJE30_02775 [Desulfuromonadales bacterium]|nr:hypothetical protein [Desulfuromonadales bacterium]
MPIGRRSIDFSAWADKTAPAPLLIIKRNFPIDPRIRTSCIACPPDVHPEDFWCAWEFELT